MEQEQRSAKCITEPAHPPALDVQPHAITFFTTHAQRRAVLNALERIINDLQQGPAAPPPLPGPINRTRALLIALGIERARR